MARLVHDYTYRTEYVLRCKLGRRGCSVYLGERRGRTIETTHANQAKRFLSRNDAREYFLRADGNYTNYGIVARVKAPSVAV